MLAITGKCYAPSPENISSAISLYHYLQTTVDDVMQRFWFLSTNVYEVAI